MTYQSAPNEPKPVALALRLLHKKSRSEAELRQLLKDAGVSPQDVDAAVGQASQWGYVNDERLVDVHLANARRRGKGSRWLKEALQKRQVDDALVRAAESELAQSAVDEARALIVARFARGKDLRTADHAGVSDDDTPHDEAAHVLCALASDRRLMAKAARFLSQRGFMADDIREALGARG